MRRPLYSLALIPVAAVLISSCGGTTAEPEPPGVSHTGELDTDKFTTILERGTLRVGTTGDFFASYQDPETGERSGFDIDLTRKLAEDMGVEVEYVATDWASLVSGLTAGRYDITTGVRYNSGRAQSALYTRPILRTGIVALVRVGDAERYATWDLMDQAGVVVAVRQGTMIEEQARLLVPRATFLPVAGPAIEEELISGRADVVVASRMDAAAVASAEQSVQVSAAHLQQPNYIAMLVPQSDHTLRVYIDNWLVAQEYTGYIAELLAGWNLDI